jgi:hypothetical protein
MKLESPAAAGSDPVRNCGGETSGSGQKVAPLDIGHDTFLSDLIHGYDPS